MISHPLFEISKHQAGNLRSRLWWSLNFIVIAKGHFGRNDDLINSFWIYLTFSSKILEIRYSFFVKTCDELLTDLEFRAKKKFLISAEKHQTYEVFLPLLKN